MDSVLDRCVENNFFVNYCVVENLVKYHATGDFDKYIFVALHSDYFLEVADNQVCDEEKLRTSGSPVGFDFC